MGQVKFSVNGQPTTAAISLREIKRKFNLTSDEVGNECFLSGQTIDYGIAEKENISTRTYSMVISYIRKKLTPKQTIMSKNQPRTRVVKRATPEQLSELKEKIAYLRGTHLSAKELAKVFGVSVTSISRAVNEAEDFSENTYHQMMSCFNYYMKTSSLPLIATPEEEKTVLKSVAKAYGPTPEILKAAIRYLLKVRPGNRVQKEIGIFPSVLYKYVNGHTLKLRQETVDKLLQSPIILNYIQGNPPSVATITTMPEVKPQETYKITMEKVEDITGVNPKLLILSAKTKLEAQLNDLKGLEAMINNTPEDMKTEIYPKVISRIYAIVPREKV